MLIRRWLPAASVIAATVTLTGALVPTAVAAEEPTDATGAPYAVEDGAYPYSGDVLAATGARLVAGDGKILHVSCEWDHAFSVWARTLTTEDSRICFRAADTGYLTVDVPGTYRIETYGRDIRAGVSTDGRTEALDIPRDTSREFTAGKEPVLLDLRVTGSSAPPTEQPGTSTYGFTGRLSVGLTRSCTATLVDPRWAVTTKSCLADDPARSIDIPAGAPRQRTTLTLGRDDLATTGTVTRTVSYVVPRADRDLAMVWLDKPATGVTPVTLSAAAPVTGERLTVAGFGRTAFQWAPTAVHTGTFTVGSVATTGFGLDAAASSPDATICKGAAGGPALRTENGGPALVAVTSTSWQGGCMDSGQTRTGAHETRVDDVRGWVQQVRDLGAGWKTEALVQGGTRLFQGIRLADGTWTGFTDVEAEAGPVGPIRASAVAGIGTDTHVVALGGDGRLRHAVRRGDGHWTGFGDVNAVAGALTNISRVSTVSIGHELHVLAIAGGRPYHTVRRQDGTWSVFGDVTGAAGPLSTATSVATASAGGQLHVAVVVGGKVQHSVRASNGVWTTWGDVASAAGATGPVTSVTMAGTGVDTHMVIATDNGTRQYHTLRTGNGSWTGFATLAGIVGQVTATSVAGASVDGEFQLALTTSDGRVLHTVRHTDRTWSTAAPVDLRGVSGTATAAALAGTL
ncbi:hypothetical protein ACFYV5_06615 [Streptomyces sp. NPDC003035]|uniref:hypothetical protein n=1 Tax=Streptomyces sp. NPDC003035 TaxID=3364676 RepID=UPI0036CC649B